MRRTIVLLGGFALMAAGTARAQSGWTAAPAKAPAKSAGVRTAGMAPDPAPAPAPAQPVVVNTTGFPTYHAPGVPAPNTTGLAIPNSTGLHTNFVAPSVAQVSYYPTIVLTDGRVLANFGTGRGYEEVLRRCPQALPPGARVAPCWTVDANGNYRVLQQR